ncbi:ArgP/LysG family DNA-binding transcriptional regulator [Agrobacterium vitis]|uniref:LysR family transcriptional regulator ArgP n=1 Tax=Agrobacterium vitis TaxID=373 RepID=UPI0012E97B47|nr:LysR family transcriptional regulator ArgP [Agrobacterium vitis]MVA73333.1 ArgP/LysG family DNA-binding transcriptional regulator [Agrobacterium vitis]
MAFDGEHLSALVAVLRSGSFEKAARQLGVTQSAISQRIKLLEERSGTALIIRGQPCLPTSAGARLCRHAEEVALLERQVIGDLGLAQAAQVTVRLAVNADSLATWFVPAMAAVEGLLFDLVLDDQDHSADWLRRGEVRAAVTSLAAPVQGCDCRPLGLLTYRATASPDFAARWFPQGVTAEALAVAPCLTFNAKDGLQTAWMEQVAGCRLSPPCHWLPSSQAFIDASRLGLGWGMNPAVSVAALIAEGVLVDLRPDQPLAVPLYWHWSRALGRALDPLTASVLAAARQCLLPMARKLPSMR